MTPLRIIVCGGRTYDQNGVVFELLDFINLHFGVASMCHGKAKGADEIANNWAGWRSIPVTAYPADWAKHGNAGGPIRNQQMLDEARPDLVVAFPGGRGTQDMIARARKAGVRVMEVPA